MSMDVYNGAYGKLCHQHLNGLISFSSEYYVICFQFRKRPAFVSIRYRNHMRERQQISIKIRTRTEQALLKQGPKTQSLSSTRKCKMIRFNTKTLQNTHTQSDSHTYTHSRAKRITLQTIRMFGCCWHGKCVCVENRLQEPNGKTSGCQNTTNKQKEKTKRIIICQPTKNIRLGQAVRIYNTI